MIGNKEFDFRKAHDWIAVTGLLLVLCFYTYGTIVFLNALFDTSPPKIYPATVISKRIDDDKITTYYFTLSAWGPQHEPDEVYVTAELYNVVDTSREVHVQLKNGWLGARWFIVTQ
jgi:hypothetical protein